MSKPGRDAKGHYQRDDRMLRDAVDRLAQAMSLILPVIADLSMDAQGRIDRVTDAASSVNDVFALLELIDVGTKPGKESNDGQSGH